jgi:malto-oligosyltrehalose trehalohydrolase
VRAFAIENALHWLRHYRFDGLRLDAVHAIAERREPSLLTDLSRAVGQLASETGRKIHLVLENDDNTASLLDPLEEPPRGHYRAQWNDDYHHAWHTLLTRERGGYYQDYVERPLDHITRVLSSGFSYQGETSAHRHGRVRGERSDKLSPLAFVNFLQNHDQIGNRPLGERLSMLVDPAPLTAALAITLLAPMPPLLFMGEEWGSTRPFPFRSSAISTVNWRTRCGTVAVANSRQPMLSSATRFPILCRWRRSVPPRSTGMSVANHNPASGWRLCVSFWPYAGVRSCHGSPAYALARRIVMAR